MTEDELKKALFKKFEEKKKKKRGGLVAFLFVVGLWSVVAVGIFYAVVIFSHLDLLKGDPCEACMNLTGRVCTDESLNFFGIDLRDAEPNPMDALALDSENDIIKLGYPLDTLTSIDLEGIK